jgi:4-amino-4-deoxy-L-arabinose transferase-like glycosyltransferase
MTTSRVKHSHLQRNTPSTQPAQQQFFPRVSHLDLAVCAGLILSMFFVYAQVSEFDFVNYHDPDYVSSNPHVQEGLTAGGLKWAATAVVSSNWMPLTLLSHMLDAQLFGVRSGMHHLVNVLFHALAAVLLFIVFRRTTGSPYASAFVAFLFALHPLHVGSIAWIAERKDVLSTFLCFLALYFYVRYTERPSTGRYLAVAGVFALGLMSKPMLVSFPFVLLLFDLWPLRRMQWPKSVLEKIPLFVLSAAASVVTYLVQNSVGVVQKIPLGYRVRNALVSCVSYVAQVFRPVRLAVFYPLKRDIAQCKVIAALLALVALSSAVIYAWRARPYVAVGWFWYLGTLVLVIGLVQVGAQAHAGRYMYIPLVGLSVILAWGALDIIRRWPRTQPAFIAAAVGCCLVSMAIARTQTEYWRNSETSFRRAAQVSRNNWVAETNLAHCLMMSPDGRPRPSLISKPRCPSLPTPPASTTISERACC